ncbi:hypothetical protein [Myxococcus sp. Y35]|uniref:hypothetical protein n=1 Tax=Pseudomyxococcus flavus TaxID=3115648 RepID=UPI003CF3ABCB
MKTRQWMRGGLLALLVGVYGAAGPAWGQSASVTRAAKTQDSFGEAGDRVVASVVETGARTGARQLVTLQLVNNDGVVVAETSGVVDPDSPLRLNHRAPTAAPLFARVIATVSGSSLSAAVVTVERWAAADPTAWTEPLTCYFELNPPAAMPRPPPVPPGPVTLKCEPIVPPPPSTD